MANGITVVNNVPVPDKVGRGGREPKYPFRDMQIGQCIEFFSERELAAARNAAYREKQRNPEFNYGAVVCKQEEYERDETGDIKPDARRVYGRLWRLDPED